MKLSRETQKVIKQTLLSLSQVSRPPLIVKTEKQAHLRDDFSHLKVVVQSRTEIAPWKSLFLSLHLLYGEATVTRTINALN